MENSPASLKGNNFDEEDYVRVSMDRAALSDIFSLEILAQPSNGVAFGINEYSRLALRPHTTVLLKVKDTHGEAINIRELAPFLVCQASLVTATNESADMVFASPSRYYYARSTPLSTTSQKDSVAQSESLSSTNVDRCENAPLRTMYGNVVASLQEMTLQPSNKQIMAYLFTDLSIRVEGVFRLHINLLHPQNGVISSITSEEILVTMPSKPFVKAE